MAKSSTSAHQPRSAHFVVPQNIDDPKQPSGGNRYDRRVCDELSAAGWQVREHRAAGSWPWADSKARRQLRGIVETIPDGSAMLVDGLIASNAPDVFVPAARRLRMVVLLHTPLVDMPLQPDVAEAHRRESAVLSAAQAIVTTSRWAREQLLARYPLPAEHVVVAEPGADAAELATPSRDGKRLVCVAALAAHKGHDVLLDALADVADLDWNCRLVGALGRAPDYVAELRRRAAAAGIAPRVEFCGSLDSRQLDQVYRRADLLLHTSRYETYGMVVTEALARGVPVVAARVGGLPEALGQASNGDSPGVLTPPGDPAALAAAIRCWLQDPVMRDRLREAAADRRGALAPWSTTAARIAASLRGRGNSLAVPA